MNSVRFSDVFAAAKRLAAKATKSLLLFLLFRMKKSKYHRFRCLIHEIIPDFHADFNGGGLNCDNHAQNEKFAISLKVNIAHYQNANFKA